MNSAMRVLFEEIRDRNGGSAERALAELIQQIVVLALSRGDFFSKAAFYGGTALRMIHGLERFSEDLDFSLSKPLADFPWKAYLKDVKEELSAYGFVTEVEAREKRISTPVESAFIKADTLWHILQIAPSEASGLKIHPGSLVKVKMEIDTEPPPDASFSMHYLDDPVPHSVRAYDLPSLFAGKIAATLARAWKRRVKGRDWYDMVFYVRKKVPVNLTHLESRLRQAGYYRETAPLTAQGAMDLLVERIDEVDFEKAKEDAFPFIVRPKDMDIWSADFFRQQVSRISFLDKAVR